MVKKIKIDNSKINFGGAPTVTPMFILSKENKEEAKRKWDRSYESNPIINNGVTSPEYKDQIVKRRDRVLNYQGQRGKNAALQDQLFNIGAFGNMAYEKAVDGIIGKNTRAALQKAVDLGYVLNKETGVLEKIPSSTLNKNNSVYIPKEASMINPNMCGVMFDYIVPKIKEQIVNDGKADSVARYITTGAEFLFGGALDAVKARIRAADAFRNPNKYPDIEFKNGIPTITLDKKNHLVRFYNESGDLVRTAVAGTGFVNSGNPKVENDNQTPSGTFILSSPELGKNKKGGTRDFGTYFYRTNHKYPNGKLSGIGLHGTGSPIFNGMDVSHGCVRLDNKDIEWFHDNFKNSGAGTRFIIYKNGGKL